MNITSEIVVAYSVCPRKAFLLLHPNHAGAASARPHEYIQILKRQQDLSRNKFQENITQQSKNEPVLVVGTQNVIRDQKIELAFMGQALGLAQRNVFPPDGVIITSDGQAHRVRLRGFYKKLKPMIEALNDWTQTPTAETPPVILNRHCPYCPFREQCRKQAEKDDSLSLLDRMTPKLMRSYHKKGIFTVNQLSYLFKPRRNRKPNRKTHLHFKPELQALAMRTGKIYIQQSPQISRASVELFFDIEGKPDQNFSYLMGLLVCEGENRIYHAFWADTPEEEEHIWNQLLEEVGRYPQAPIYHYGRYEQKIVAQLAKRYRTQCDDIIKRLINVNAYIYGKVYFPVRSNNLKELGKFIGASWTSSEASGLQSLVWRDRWEQSLSDERSQYKQTLLTYNEEDCRALQLLTDSLSRIARTADLEAGIDFADRPKRNATERGKEIHVEFEQMLRNAHADYARNRITVRAKRTVKERPTSDSARIHRVRQRAASSRISKVVRVPIRRTCPHERHKGDLLERSNLEAKKTLIDLRFTENGCRKTVTRYVGTKGYCARCHIYYNPRGIGNRAQQLFGWGFQAWAVYQRIALRLPYSAITQTMEDLFNERMSEPCLIKWLGQFAQYYAATENILIRHILKSPFIHVDETRINIQGSDQYVWVFTDGRHVVFKITKTREAAIVHDLLSSYAGVLISDFYPGYDSMPCRQQKCLVHLIRDINEDLWDAHFDEEFEAFVLGVKNLFSPILGAVEKYGLKKRHLNKFRNSVEKFYKSNILDKEYKSELAMKYQKRFHRYKENLFVFLEQDSIPWNNNMAERAIRHLAIQRKISGTFFERVAIKYLRLLGIAQTCRFQGKSFFKFLLSKEKNLDKFNERRTLIY